MKQKSQAMTSTVFHYLGLANNVRKNLLRLYRKQKWKLNHLFLFPIVFLYYELLLRIFGPGSLFSSLIYPILFSLGYGLFATALTSCFKPNVNRIISMVLLYLTGLLFIVECLIRDSYQVYMTISAIKSGAGGVMTGFGGELFAAILGGLPKIILFFFPALFYTLTGRRRIPAKRYHSPFVITIFLFAFLITEVSCLLAAHGYSGEKYTSRYDFDTSIQTFGLLTGMRLNVIRDSAEVSFSYESEVEINDSSYADSIDEESVEVIYGKNEMDIDFTALIESEPNESIADIHSYVAGLTSSSQNAYTGLFEGKNLILICAEAFSDVVINEELTPTLYRMTHNGFYFSDYYQPTWGGSTSTGEYSFLFGIAPRYGNKTMPKTQNNNNYFTLGNQLQRLNYYSLSFHSGTYEFYDRNLTHRNLGYAEFYARDHELDLADYSDPTLFASTVDMYMDNQPFSVYYMTLSGHSVYKESSPYTQEHIEEVRAYYGDQYKDTTLYYLCYQMELEDAMTFLLDELERRGIADDTVICLTADHYPYGLENSATYNNSDDYVTDLYGYSYNYSWEQDHNSLIIWSGCLEHKDKDMACEISEPTYSLDIVPTLSNLFGLEYDSRLLVGRDVFSDEEPIVLWNNFSWITEHGKYDSATETYFPNDGYAVDEAYVNRINRIVLNKLNFSNQVVDNDYYGILFGTDDITTNDNYVPRSTAIITPSSSPTPISDSTIESSDSSTGT